MGHDSKAGSNTLGEAFEWASLFLYQYDLTMAQTWVV